MLVLNFDSQFLNECKSTSLPGEQRIVVVNVAVEILERAQPSERLASQETRVFDLAAQLEDARVVALIDAIADQQDKCCVRVVNNSVNLSRG